MKPRVDVPFTQWAAIHQTEKFIAVERLSGYRRSLPEDDGYRIYLEPDVTEKVLGRALLEALNRSRFIDPRKEREFFEPDRTVKSYKNWQKDFMTRYGYKTKREAYKNMRYCKAERREGKISIEPHRPDKLDTWTTVPADKIVAIPATTDPAIVGAALKLALSRCE